jgi:hypothetical protein
VWVFENTKRPTMKGQAHQAVVFPGREKFTG